MTYEGGKLTSSFLLFHHTVYDIYLLQVDAIINKISYPSKILNNTFLDKYYEKVSIVVLYNISSSQCSSSFCSYHGPSKDSQFFFFFGQFHCLLHLHTKGAFNVLSLPLWWLNPPLLESISLMVKPYLFFQEPNPPSLFFPSSISFIFIFKIKV